MEVHLFMNYTTQNPEQKNIVNDNSLDAEFTYQVNGISFVVQLIFKEKSSETLGSVLLRLMTSSE